MKIKNIIILQWDSLVLSLASIAYGVTLYINNSILQTYKVYDLIDEIFDNHAISLVFIFFGLMKLIGIFINHKKMKRVALIGLSTIWSVFSVSFIMTPPPNTVWIFSLAMAVLAFGIALREN